MLSTQTFVPTLMKNGFRITGQRQAIIQILRQNDRHMNAYEIHEELRKRNYRVSMATVYRTLDLFAELKLITRIKPYNQPAVYELAKKNKANPIRLFLICRMCHRIIDVPGTASKRVNELMQQLGQEHRFGILTQAISVEGICENCQNANRRS